MRFHRFIQFAAVVVLFQGCATTPDPTRVDLSTSEKLASEQNSPEKLKPYYQRLFLEGESNGTLNRMRLASAAIELGEWKRAETALDAVIQSIEALGPADARSREALETFTEEEIKRFKGEPYERAMACLLRGLLYAKTRDWQNARACFKSVHVQDAVKADPALHGSWSSAEWLEGWCDWQLGEKTAAHECWERAARLGKIPAPAATDNALVVVLLGFGPVKIPKGKYGEELSYRAGDSRATQARLKVRKESTPLMVAEDVLLQAQSRGRRQMDRVNEGKAEARQAAETAGDVLIGGGAVTTVGGLVTEDTTVAAAGLGAMAAGMATKGIASSIKPKADTRVWDLLPAQIQLLPFRVLDGDRNLELEFLDAAGNGIARRTIELLADSAPQLMLFTQR